MDADRLTARIEPLIYGLINVGRLLGCSLRRTGSVPELAGSRLL